MHTINTIVTKISNSIVKVAKGWRPYLSPVPPKLLTPDSPPNYASNTSITTQAPVSQTECSNSIQHDQEVKTCQKAPFLLMHVVCREFSRKLQPPQGDVVAWRRTQRSATVLQGAQGHTGYTPPQSSATPRALHTHSPTIVMRRNMQRVK